MLEVVNPRCLIVPLERDLVLIFVSVKKNKYLLQECATCSVSQMFQVSLNMITSTPIPGGLDKLVERKDEFRPGLVLRARALGSSEPGH